MNNLSDNPVHPTTIGDALTIAHERLVASDVFFGHGTDNPWDEAVQLVLAAAELPADSGEEVLPVALGEDAWLRAQGMLGRRINEHVPLPYLTGVAWFAGLQFGCDERAIIPRSPLAEVIHDNFQPWYSGSAPRRILDLCCGGGCIGLAAAYYHPDISVDLVDLDPDALALASENIGRYELQGRVRAVQSDLFTALAQERYDVILSNPPYVDAADIASMPAEYHHEPALALASGADGLNLTRRILAQAHNYLTPDGLLLIEVGNSWEALDAAYPELPLTWLEFEQGGHGVLALSAAELQDYHARTAR
ncbi:MAG: 50S ribosomal protein L3 N(5)-glutamine methyltransferase [Halieaceae bacterium]